MVNDGTKCLKKRLLFVNGHLNVGGVEKSLIEMLRNIDYSLYNVDLVLLNGLGDYLHQVPKEINIIFRDLTKSYGPFIKCLINNIKNKDFFTMLFRVIVCLDKFFGVSVLSYAKPLFGGLKKYDCAIAYRIGICTEFVGYIVDANKKITWWHHGEYGYSEKITNRWNKVYRKFHNIIAVSDSCKKMLIKHVPSISNKLITIPNIIDCNEIRTKSFEQAAYCINYNEHITLLSVGRLSPEKGMINCVHACKKLIEGGYDIKWYLIGDGVQRNEIEECIKEYKLENHIYLLGSIQNPYPYMKNVYMYVHPSIVESLSITVLESLTLNTPVVVAKSMGPMEFIRDKDNGLLVEPTPEGLYGGIVSLINNKDLYKQLKNDKNDVLKNYSPESVIKKIYDVIECD